MISDFDPIITYCQELLQSFPPASKVKEYIDTRLSKASQKKFQFGYFPTNEHLHILEETVGPEILSKVKTNLVFDRVADERVHRHGVLEEHNLIMPYKDVYGKTIGIVGRTIQNDDEREISKLHKYKNTSFDKGKHLFGMNFAKKSIVEKNQCVILEGQFDLIRAHEAEVTNAVALGGSNMTMEQLALILRYCDEMVLLLDTDEAGEVGTKRIESQFGYLINIKRAKLPNGYKDFDEMGEIGKIELNELIV